MRTVGDHYGKYFLVSWEKEAFDIKTEIKEYKTAFGDPSLSKPRSEYSTYRVTIVIHRKSWELFLKLFLGMYISFLISSTCFYLPADKIDSRLTLSVGSLFAVIGNKYIVDSTLPESSTFTLVDILHAITLFYIFITVAYSIYSYRVTKEGEINRADKIVGIIAVALYLLANLYCVYHAYSSDVVS